VFPLRHFRVLVASCLLGLWVSLSLSLSLSLKLVAFLFSL
jgi:hypothetical protein